MAKSFIAVEKMKLSLAVLILIVFAVSGNITLILSSRKWMLWVIWLLKVRTIIGLDFAQKNYTAKKSLSHKETAYPRGRDGDSHSPVLGSSHRIVAWYSSLVSQ